MEHDVAGMDWHWLLSRLGSAEELERSARRFGAFERRRQIRDGESLLRLCLGYGCGLSLRETAAWAGITGIAALSDVAVLNRLRGSADWLSHLAGAVLAGRALRPTQARTIRIVDGSTVRSPGGMLHRLHAAYDLTERRFTHLELTDHKGAEKLERAPVQAGEIRIGDRCYARPEGVRHLVGAGGDFVLRVGWKSLCLHHPEGGRLDLSAMLESLAPGESVDIAVDIRNGRKRSLPPVPARLIVIGKDEKAAAKSRKRARLESRRGQSVIQPETLRAADYIMLVTSLDRETYPAAEVAALYRLRWQIELAFKRLKSLLDFSRLPAKDPELARTWLLSKMLMALILEDLDQEILDSPPCADDIEATPLDLEADQDPLSDADGSNPGQTRHCTGQNPSTMVAQRPRRASAPATS